MNHLIHVASGTPVKVGHVVLDRNSTQLIVDIIPTLPLFPRLFCSSTDGSVSGSFLIRDIGVAWAYPDRASIYDGDIVEYQGLKFRVQFPEDCDADAPWENGDGYGVISEKTSRNKRPGERVIGQSDYGARHLYDWQASMQKARAEGWDAEPYGSGTPGERAARAVQADYDFHNAWLNDEWRFVGCIVTLCEDEGTEDACWGFETYKDYHMEAAWEMIEHMADAHHKAVAEAAKTARLDEEKAHQNHLELQLIANNMWNHISRNLDALQVTTDRQIEVRQDFNRLCAAAGVPRK